MHFGWHILPVRGGVVGRGSLRFTASRNLLRFGLFEVAHDQMRLLERVLRIVLGRWSSSMRRIHVLILLNTWQPAFDGDLSFSAQRLLQFDAYFLDAVLEQLPLFGLQMACRRQQRDRVHHVE